MSHSDHNTYRLTLNISTPGLSIMVLDSEGSVVARSEGEFELSTDNKLEIDLPRGLYILRSIRGGMFKEIPIRHYASNTVDVDSPPHFSAANIPSAETTHEYYTYPAWQASYDNTGSEISWNDNAKASLLVFIRAPRADRYSGEELFASLSLRTPQGEILTRFETDVRRDLNAGWAAYSVDISPGVLVLEDEGQIPRQIPVPLISGWQTQLFVMYHHTRLWQDMRVATISLEEIATRQFRDPYNSSAEDISVTTQIDFALFALQNDVHAVATQLVNSFLHLKFQNPVLGLLGAYLLLIRARRRSTPAFLKYKKVLDNLSNLLPDSPDVVALRLMAGESIESLSPNPIQSVPLFRHGAEVLISAAVDAPSLVPEGSLLDAISENLYADTVWTTWRTLPLPVTSRLESYTPETPDWVELAVADAITAAVRRDAEPAVEEIVRQVGVSPTAFRDAFDRLMSRAANRVETLQANGYDLSSLDSDVVRQLAHQFESRVYSSLLPQVIDHAKHIAATSAPTYQAIYAGLKRTLANVAQVEVRSVSADTKLMNLLDVMDTSGKLSVRHQLNRHFKDANLRLTIEDLRATDTVRELAHLIKAQFKR